MILYESDVKGVHYKLGTSGFLYRSDKLMFDEKTHSLWHTIEGRPVVGPLVGKGILLKRRSVVTTTWGEWKRRHPKTTVLALDTGFDRNYDEGVAYQSYFSTDALMFNVSKVDKRLKNKAEVLGLIFNGNQKETLAIDVAYLSANPVYHGKLGKQEFVILTDRSGAARVYDGSKLKVKSFDGDATLIDETGLEWKLYEDRIESSKKDIRKRLPQHRAFWFGWFATFPKTKLIKLEKK